MAETISSSEVDEIMRRLLKRYDARTIGQVRFDDLRWIVSKTLEEYCKLHNDDPPRNLPSTK